MSIKSHQVAARPLPRSGAAVRLAVLLALLSAGCAEGVAPESADHAGSAPDVPPALAADIAADFAELDRNRDGYLSAAERNSQPPGLRAMLSAADANADGRLDSAEFAAFERRVQLPAAP